MISRFSAEAMGINLLKTAKNVGMELKIPTSDNKIPLTPMAILLID
jgi:predicted metal-binding protein